MGGVLYNDGRADRCTGEHVAFFFSFFFFRVPFGRNDMQQVGKPSKRRAPCPALQAPDKPTPMYLDELASLCWAGCVWSGRVGPGFGFGILLTSRRGPGGSLGPNRRLQAHQSSCYDPQLGRAMLAARNGSRARLGLTLLVGSGSQKQGEKK